MKIQNLIRNLFGHDEYRDGVHIAHEPSWWQRRKALIAAQDAAFAALKAALEDPNTRIIRVE